MITHMLSCGLIVRKNLLIGNGFDEQFGVGAPYGSSEETDLLIRLSKFTNITFQKEWKILHPCEQTGATRKNLFKKFSLMEKAQEQ